MVCTIALLQATFPTMFSLVPLYAKSVGGGKNLPQVLYSAIGLGAMLSALTVSKLSSHFGRAKVLSAMLIGGSASMLVASQLHAAVPAVIVAFVFGGTSVPAFVLIGGVVQREAPEAFRGRITSIQGAVIGLVFGIMAPFSGWLADSLWGLRTQFMVSGGTLAVVITLALVFRPAWRGYVNSGDPVPVREELRSARDDA
jgi:MFS family permease